MSNCDYNCIFLYNKAFPLIFRNPSAASIETFQFNLFSRVAYACSFSFFRGWNATFTFFFFAKCRPSVPLPVPPSLTVHVINGSCHMLASFAVGAILEAAAATAATSATPLANCGSTYVQQQQQLSTPNTTKTCSVHPRTLMETGQAGRTRQPYQKTGPPVASVVVIRVCSWSEAAVAAVAAAAVLCSTLGVVRGVSLSAAKARCIARQFPLPVATPPQNDKQQGLKCGLLPQRGSCFAAVAARRTHVTRPPPRLDSIRFSSAQLSSALFGSFAPSAGARHHPPPTQFALVLSAHNEISLLPFCCFRGWGKSISWADRK